MNKERIGIICAIEIDAFLEMYPDYIEIDSPPGFKLYKVDIGDCELFVLRSGMGEISAAAGVQYLITSCGVSAIVNYGVVGGLTSDMKKQKICVVDRVVHYKYDCSEFMDLAVGQVDGHDSIYLRPEESFITRAKELIDGIATVTCCSGDKFIATAEEKAYLHETFDGDVCDMESAGIILTCEMNNVPCLLLKAVSDGLADGAEGFYAELLIASKKCFESAVRIMEHLNQ